MTTTETTILLPGSAGNIETRFQEPLDNAADQIGIICHPHPLHGGTMNNKVVTTLARTFKELNMINIRFNYRGVGQSEGSYDHGIGETQDALSIIEWAHHQWPDKKIWLAGFSFGAYIALRATTEISHQKLITHLITIAPAVNHADFSGLHPHTPWIVVIAEKDTVVAADEIRAWLKTLKPSPIVLSFPEATHFFDGQLVALREALIEKLLMGDIRFPLASI